MTFPYSVVIGGKFYKAGAEINILPPATAKVSEPVTENVTVEVASEKEEKALTKSAINFMKAETVIETAKSYGIETEGKDGKALKKELIALLGL